MTSSRRMTALAIICMAASFVVALVTATRISGPSIRPDEWGYLLNGQVLIGHEEVRLPFSEMYPAGFGFVTGAWAWISGSLHSAYRLTLFTNVALIAVLAYLVVAFAVRTLHASRTTGYLIAALVVASPGTLAKHAVAALTYQIWPAISRITSGHRFTVVALPSIRLSPEGRP